MSEAARFFVAFGLACFAFALLMAIAPLLVRVRLSDFVLEREVPEKTPIGTLTRLVARVTVTTGPAWLGRVEARQITRVAPLNHYWHFVDTGRHTPGTQAEELERAWRAARALEPVEKEIEGSVVKFLRP